MAFRARLGAGMLALFGAGSSACVKEPVLRDHYCAPPSSLVEHVQVDALPEPTRSREEQLAALLGLHAVFRSVVVDGAVLTEPAQRVEVLERLELARLAIAATTAELDCESERMRQAADYLTRKQGTMVQGLTVGSIASAAVAGVASVFLSTRNAGAATQNVVGVSGSVLTTGLGLSTFFANPTVHLTHQRNLLADVWNGPPSSSNYPPVVWAYLCLPVFSNAQDAAIRVRMVARFRQLKQLERDPEALARFFGHGGAYDIDSLRTHAAMLDHVKAEVDLENQELRALAARLLP